MRRSALFIVAVVCLATAGSTLQAGAATDTEIRVTGTLYVGTPFQVSYEAIKPVGWNGTLVLDLDFNTWPTTQRQWFLSHGYAIGGNQRTQNETAYEIKGYVDNLVQTRQFLINALVAAGYENSVPTRTIAFGASRGGFVTRMAPQYRPDIFKAAVGFAGGGSGVIAAWLGKSDAVWALKMLVDPSAPLAVSGLPDIPAGATYGPNYQQDVALNALVTQARANDAGMARLVLAAAFEQAPGWPTGATEPAADDYLTQGNLIASQFAFGNPQFVHKEIEVMAGGAMTWNHGVDYADLLSRSGSLDRVKFWYQKAGLDLDADLATLAKARRFAAKPSAVAVVEDKATMNGQTGGAPVFSVKTIGDPADPVSLDEAYVRTFHAAGNDHLLRTAFIRRSGHSSQSLLERLTAFQVIVNRLDTGAWGDVTPAGLNALAAQVAAQSGLTAAQLGPSLFTEYQPVPTLRTWDFTNWGTYALPKPAVAATVAPPANAAGWNKSSVTVGLTASETLTNWALALRYGATGAGAFAETTAGATASIPVTAEGVTTLTYSASDDQGGSSGNQTLAVKIDGTPPTLNVPAATVVVNATAGGGGVVTYTASATDSGSGVGAPVCAPASGSSFPIGRTVVTCNVSDLAGNAAAPKSFAVILTAPCLTGRRTGVLAVGSGDAVCLGSGGTQTGPVTVAAGGTLDIEGATITGPVRAEGAAVVRICGSRITGPLTITGSTDLVVVGGDAATGPCAPNTITGPVVITGNTGGVEFNGNRVIGPLRITGNTGTLPPPDTGPVHATANDVTGPVTIQS